MRKIPGLSIAFTAFCLTLAFVASGQAVTSDRPVKHVRGMMGTDLDGRIIPLAAAPFGMVQLSPDTYYIASGYHYTHPEILCFSHSHACGNGGGDMQDICVMPVSGERWKSLSVYPDDIKSAYSHDREHVEPGYYTVDLLDFGIKAELTATERCGVHRYTFPSGESQFFTIDLKRGNASRPTTVPAEFHDTVIVSRMMVIDDYNVQGYRVTEGWSPEQHAYFHARFNKPIRNFKLFKDRTLSIGSDITGRDVRALFDFADDGKPLVVKVGYSPTSMDGALANIEAEVDAKDFDQVRKETSEAWDKELSAITVFDEDSAEKDIFYSSLYFALMYPQLYSDVDGGYRSSDFKAHTGNFRYYAGVLGLWDTFRAQNPLVSILRPDITSDLMKTFLEHFRNCGQLPIWTINGEENMCMTGYHSMPVIASAMARGIEGFPADSLLEAMKVSAQRDTFGFFCGKFRGAKFYREFGYVPCDLETHATSKTLEYCYDDWCIAQVARMLGKRKEYREYMRYARWYRNVFDTETGYPRGRDSKGVFRPGFDPLYDGGYGEISDFCEGNSYQYSFFVPHDVYGLMDIMGGRESFVGRLDSLFSTPVEEQVAWTGQKVGRFGFIGQYAHTNEPVHHVAYLYNYAGEPWKCQEKIREILNTQYNTSPGGMCGNDDTGQMSAWFVMSALGFYPVTHGQDIFVIGSPLFKKVKLRHSKGTLTILASGNSLDSPYVQGVKVNGRKYRKNYFRGKDLFEGDVTIEFEMDKKPNPSWGCRPKDCPPGIDGKAGKMRNINPFNRNRWRK